MKKKLWDPKETPNFRFKSLGNGRPTKEIGNKASKRALPWEKKT